MKITVDGYTVTGEFIPGTRDTRECPGDPAEFVIEDIFDEEGNKLDGNAFDDVVESVGFYSDLISAAESEHYSGWDDGDDGE